MFCTKCGAKLDEGSQFCTQCGARAWQDGTTPPDKSAVQNQEAWADGQSLSSNGNGTAAGGRRNALRIAVGAAIALIAIAAVVVVLRPFGGLGGDNGDMRQSSNDAANSAALQSPSAEQGSAEQGSAEQRSDEATSSAASGAAQAASASADGRTNASSTAAVQNDAPAQGEAAKPAAAAASVFETESIRVTMPSDLAGAGFRWSSPSSDSVALTDSNGSLLAEVLWADASTRENEAKLESYKIGEVSHGSIGFPAFLRLYYLDASGKHIYWGADDAGALATERLGVSLQDIVSWIELWHVNTFRPAALQDGSDDSGGFKTPLKEPFYGVWVSASKDYGEARSTASELGRIGLTGYVFFTTDWSNLNPEPWYVVAAGYSQTESGARALCEKVQNAGYDDAYVKYSGDYIGAR